MPTNGTIPQLPKTITLDRPMQTDDGQIVIPAGTTGVVVNIAYILGAPHYLVSFKGYTPLFKIEALVL